MKARFELSKKYRTRNGLEVFGLTEKDGEIYGWYGSPGKWKADVWNSDGSAARIAIDDLDLIEISPAEELLEEAKRRYPEGTKYICLTGRTPKIVISNGRWLADTETVFDDSGAWCYHRGQWAQIVRTHKLKVYLNKNTESGNVWASQKEIGPYTIACKEIEFYEGEGL